MTHEELLIGLNKSVVEKKKNLNVMFEAWKKNDKGNYIYQFENGFKLTVYNTKGTAWNFLITSSKSEVKYFDPDTFDNAETCQDAARRFYDKHLRNNIGN